MNRTSPLTEPQWKQLEQLADNASRALSELSLSLLTTSAQVGANDPELQTILLKNAGRVEEAKHTLLPGYFFHCQAEWLGDEKWAMREPHVTNRRFTVNP